MMQIDNFIQLVARMMNGLFQYAGDHGGHEVPSLPRTWTVVMAIVRLMN
jgi:hypothetical protein